MASSGPALIRRWAPTDAYRALSVTWPEHSIDVSNYQRELTDDLFEHWRALGYRGLIVQAVTGLDGRSYTHQQCQAGLDHGWEIASYVWCSTGDSMSDARFRARLELIEPYVAPMHFVALDVEEAGLQIEDVDADLMHCDEIKGRAVLHGPLVLRQPGLAAPQLLVGPTSVGLELRPRCQRRPRLPPVRRLARGVAQAVHRRTSRPEHLPRGTIAAWHEHHARSEAKGRFRRLSGPTRVAPTTSARAWSPRPTRTTARSQTRSASTTPRVGSIRTTTRTCPSRRPSSSAASPSRFAGTSRGRAAAHPSR